MDPLDLVIVPAVAMVIPDPLEKIPDVRFRLVIVILELVVNVELARLRVSVPRVVLPASNPKSVGKVPDPSTTITDEPVTERSSGIEGPHAPLTVNVLLPIANTPAV